MHSTTGAVRSGPSGASTDDVAHAEQHWNTAALTEDVCHATIAFWHYTRPAIVFGCSQRALMAQAGVASAAHATPTLPLLRRGAGGGAVLVGPWMSGLSIALPTGHPLARLDAVESYRWLGERVAATLQSAGLPDVAVLKPGQPPPSGPSGAVRAQLAWACFGGLSPWEVTTAGRKVFGLAQRRRRTGVLLVGGILWSVPDWSLLCTPLGRSADEPALLARVTAACSEFLDPHALERLRADWEQDIARALQV